MKCLVCVAYGINSLLLWYMFVYKLVTSIETRIEFFGILVFFYEVCEVSCIF